MFCVDGPTFAVLRWFWCPHSKNTEEPCSSFPVLWGICLLFRLQGLPYFLSVSLSKDLGFGRDKKSLFYRSVQNWYPRNSVDFELIRRRVLHCAVIIVLKFAMRSNSASCYVETPRLDDLGVKMTPKNLMNGVSRHLEARDTPGPLSGHFSGTAKQPKE